MTAMTAPEPGIEAPNVLRERSLALLRRFARFVRTQPVGALGLVLVILILVIAIFGEWMVRTDPNALSPAFQEGPSTAHWFGTDNNGRDYYSRMMSGGRPTIALAVIGVIFGFIGGTFFGVVSAWAKGWVDLLFQRIVDSFLALPGIILALFLVTVLGRDTLDLIIVLTLLVIPPTIRVARSVALSLLNEPYIEAAYAMGARTPRVLGVSFAARRPALPHDLDAGRRARAGRAHRLRRARGRRRHPRLSLDPAAGAGPRRRGDPLRRRPGRRVGRHDAAACGLSHVIAPRIAGAAGRHLDLRRARGLDLGP